MIENLVRPQIKNFIPYNANQIPYSVKLDANESPFDLPKSVKQKLAEYFLESTDLNLYPDTDSIELRKALAQFWNADFDGIVVGTGSDQLIQVLIHVFAGKDDKVLCPTPSFGMYKLTTTIAGGVPVDFMLDRENNFSYDAEKLVDVAKKEKVKIIFLCTPNNPTGGVIPQEHMIQILEECRESIIVVDEAYAEFSRETMIPFVTKYENLVVLRTFSKAYGLAGIRCGYSISGTVLANELNKVRPPYNISSLSQRVAKLVLEAEGENRENIQTLIKERDYLTCELSRLKDVTVYPSEANFLLIKVPDSQAVHVKLVEKGILIRNFGSSPMLENCLRITVGTRVQNEALLLALRSVM